MAYLTYTEQVQVGLNLCAVAFIFCSAFKIGLLSIYFIYLFILFKYAG